jgi:N-acetylglucosaminyldiphosphoundecaprenol N-acetyl-beta-D-mannosaminyltransferase
LGYVAFHVADHEWVGVNTSRRAQLLAEVEARLASRRGFSVATLNLDHLVKLRRSAAFRRAYAAQTHVVADGNPIVWISRIARHPVELTPGCELVEPIAAIAARHGAPVALLGARTETLALAADRLAARHPGLRLPARIAPGFGFDPAGPEADACIEALRDSGARVCFLALGAPKQEEFAARAQAALPEVGFVSIGAGLDFIAGTQALADQARRARNRRRC